MLLARTQGRLAAAAPESTTMTVGRLLSMTTGAPIAKAATPTAPTRQASTPQITPTGRHAPEAQDAEEPQPGFWQGEPAQPRPAAPHAPAEEQAVWEACEYLRGFVRDNWGEGAAHAAVIECEVPMARICEFGRLPERQGTRCCTRLVRIPVLAEEIGHRLWRMLSEEAALDALADGGERESGPAVLLALWRDCDVYHGQEDLELASVEGQRPQYRQCWNCHGQGKYQEVEEAAGSMTSCYRCMECFNRFDVKTVAMSSRRGL
ncbi:hypothetical protein PpBr36_08604 [Pyricularia pennisetigena]|uniref:hypothetical protein n=1 Tax=Pyricularia pennisetigena TaxID=1578925 RepID=UPI001153BA99|nr:hypothetical protein PpBr36_08604 [Pyricularia pennisetigena]TLS24872.1 hypothetical protein PpBr36_08604 [Pyricularia pennisetigena]